jgi:hypothetical protein
MEAALNTSTVDLRVAERSLMPEGITGPPYH